MLSSKKIWWTSFLSCIIAIVFIAISLSVLFIAKNNVVVLDTEKIMNSQLQIDIYDNENNIISDNNRYTNKFVKLETLPDYIKESFISIEDKKYYNHNGLNVKRMIKAAINNIKAFKIVEGASTISQQLIKNTHLSSDRTFSRKINEIILTLQLEKILNKNEIIENYLNIIYYGNGTYGIENAANYYFSKNAKNLTLGESCVLAGMIKSPALYSPITNYDKCLKRRNLVLCEMYKDNKITKEDYLKEIEKPITLNINENTNKKINTYADEVINEASKILKIPAKQISLNNYKIYTYYSPKKQRMLEDSIVKDELNNNDYSAISINNKTLGIEAYTADSPYEVLATKRQPGSTIKPILVYGPALNENIISPATQILDEKIDINGYSPNNVTKTFSGYVSVRESLSKSMNIPAIKILSYIGIDKGISYAKKLNIPFDELDNNYAIALGGMTNGVNLKELTTAYTSYANNGIFKDSSFIKYITNKNGKIVYSHNPIPVQVLREDSNYLLLDMLKECTKNGTSKRLSTFNFDIASKTGTVGNDNHNSDTWNVSLTTNDTVGVWIGNLKTSNIGNIVGGRENTEIVKRYFQNLYSSKKPTNFPMPSSVCYAEIDTISLNENHIIERANEFIPEKYKTSELFSRFNLPKEKSSNFLSVTPATLSGSIDSNDNIKLSFKAENYLTYDLYQVIDEKEDKLIETFSNKDEIVEHIIKQPNEKRSKYYLITKIKNHTTGYEILSDKSNIIEIISSKKSQLINTLPIKKRKWYIMASI